MRSLNHLTNLADLLTLAVEDMEAIKANPDYIFNTSVWHSPTKDKCIACVAGSIMANTLKAPISVFLSPANFPERTQWMLHLINKLRLGESLSTRPAYKQSFNLPITDSQLHSLHQGINMRELRYGDTNQWERLRDNAKELGL